MIKQRFVAISCSHGIDVDRDAWDWAMDFVGDYKPHVGIHLGDAIDLAALRKGATNEEKNLSVEEDIHLGLEHLSEFAKAVKSDTYYLLGNHEMRLYQMRHNLVGIARDYASNLIEQIERDLAKMGYPSPLPYDSKRGILEMGGVLFMHGYSHAENADKKLVDDYKRPVVFGHTHSALKRWHRGWPESVPAMNVGCLRTLDPEYMARITSSLKWTHAVGYGEFLSNGTATLKLLER